MIIDKLKAIELLERAVAERGADYVYPKNDNDHGGACRYSWLGKPDCIVGLALFLETDNIDLLQSMDNAGPIDDDDMPAALAHYDIELTDEAMRTLYLAQHAQDTGETWGAALEAAKRTVDA